MIHWENMRPTEILPDFKNQIVTVDCETSGLYPDDGCRVSTVSVAWFDGEEPIGLAFPFDQGQGNKGGQADLFDPNGDHNLPEGEWRCLLEWLSEQWLVNQNLKFDLHHLRVGTRFWPGRCLVERAKWDTMLGTAHLDPMQPTSLKPTAARHQLLDGSERDEEEAVKAWLKGYAKRTKQRYSDIAGRYDLVPWDVIGPYAAKDAVLALLLWAHQIQRLEIGEGDRRRLEQDMRRMRTLYQMEKRGIGYDSARSLEIADELDDRAAKVAADLPFDPSLKDAKRYFFGPQSGRTPYAVTEKKQEPQLNDEILRKMVKDGIEHAAAYQEYRKLETAQSMWYRGYPAAIGPDGRLRTDYRQAKVVSGRLSAERINLTAIPHDYKLDLLGDVPSVRDLFIPAEGKVLWELDLAQAELRVAARMANAKRMLRLIEEGADAHGDTARELFQVKPGDRDWFKYRQVSKRGNFSLIFGVGGQTLDADVRKQTGIELGRLEADRIVYDWRRIHPEFQRAIYRHSEVAEQRRWIRLANDKLRWFAPHEDTHKAFNQRVQGSIAELVLDWMCEVEDRLPDVLLLQIHDSLVLELEPDTAEQVALEMAELGKKMAEAMFDVPMEVEAKQWGDK